MESNVLQSLMTCQDYRSFMRIWIDQMSATKKLGYADIARFGGFSSRSFPRDVLNGTKRLTLNSLPKMIRGLRLNGSLASFFRLLVELEHEDCRAGNSSTHTIEESIEKIRERTSSKTKLESLSADNVYALSDVPTVYAALGSVEGGSHISDIISRTNLPETAIHEALEKMIEFKIVQKKKFRFYPTNNHVSFEGLKKSDLFKQHFKKSCERAKDSAAKKFDSDDHLFLSSAFSINKSDLPKLKEDLRALLLTYVDSSEKQNGNSVVNLVASLF